MISCHIISNERKVPIHTALDLLYHTVPLTPHWTYGIIPCRWLVYETWAYSRARVDDSFEHACLDYICSCVILIGFSLFMTTQNIALTPREQKLPMLFPLGVVVRFRSAFTVAFTRNMTPRPSGQQLLKLFWSWVRRSLEHTLLSSYFG